MADRAEQERRERTAEFLRAERERYEYLLLCAKDAEHEELAWETIVAKMTVEDFVTAANEVLAARKVVEAARYADADAPDPWRRYSTAMDGLRSTLRKYDRLDPPATYQPGGDSDG